ncbi:MAG: InlB B-repeat-containing protein [Bacillota bacterium]|nr:InlB B-repeat-containing protein [Bacillota bacterium]
MKKTIVSVLLILCTLLALFPVSLSAAPLAATYHPDDVAVLNAIAAAHPELGWAQAPEDGSGKADGWANSVWWNEDTPKRVYKLGLDEKGLSGSLDVRGLTKLMQLSCAFNALSSIDANDLQELYKLNCAHNALTSLNVSGSTALKNLYCDRNKLTELDLSGFPALYWVHCEYNELTTLNVTGLTNLTYVFCDCNRLSTLDFSNLEKLRYISCYSNQLTSLSVSGCAELEGLECYCNQLGSLEVTGLTALEYLDCSHNLLTGSLDVTNTALSTLYCNNNRLSGLNLGSLTDLYMLECQFNQLTSLDVSGLTALEDLSCYSNKLTTLDVRALSELYHLNCEDNLLTSLNVRDLENLLFLYCGYNYLTELDVYGTGLRRLWIRSNCLTDQSEVTGKTIDWDGEDFRYDTQYPEYVDVTFTAEQTGGVSGTTDSTGIVLTFDQAVADLPPEHIYIRGKSGEVFMDDLICSDESNVSDTWTIVLDAVFAEEELSIFILSFENYRLPKEPQTTMVYKATGPVTYKVTVHGGTAVPETAIMGTVVEITTNPAEDGKRFAGWTVNSGGAVLADATAAVTSFQMPANDVDITANYEDVYYQVTVHGGTADRETAILGANVEITANPAEDGKRFSGWTVNSGGAVLADATAIVTNFQMPANDVDITANYADVYYQVTVHGGTADRETAILGANVEITANPAEDGKRFAGWIVNSGGAVLADATAAVTSFQMPANDVDITANYEDVNYQITVHGGTADWETAILGTSVEITANPAEDGKRFAGWIVNSGGAVLADAAAVVTSFQMPAQDVDITANYEDVPEPDPYQIVVFRTGWQTEYCLGDAVALAARAEGGTPPYRYEFYTLGPDDTKTILRNEAYSNTYSWTPTKVGDYRVGVEVKDATGQILHQVKELTILNTPLELAVFRTGWQTEYCLGDTVALAARAEGGVAPYRYQFYAVGSDGVEHKLRNYAYSNIYGWEPLVADTWQLGVRVKDATGDTVSQLKNVTVRDFPPLGIAVFRAGYKDRYNSGEAIPLAARAEGGAPSYRYQFYWVDVEGTKTVLRDYAWSNIFSWIPKVNGNYEVHVSVKDSNGTVIDEQRRIYVGPAD